jgi:hypothetical protein
MNQTEDPQNKSHCIGTQLILTGQRRNKQHILAGCDAILIPGCLAFRSSTSLPNVSEFRPNYTRLELYEP